MEVYRAEEDDLIRVEETQFDREETLENHLVKSDGATIGAVEVLYIGRQGSPDQGESSTFWEWTKPETSSSSN